MPNGSNKKWILVYQDHLKKFCILRALTSKRAAEVTFHLLHYFLPSQARRVQSPQPRTDEMASQPGTVTLGTHLDADLLPQASTSSKALQQNGITALQHLTGAIKTGQIQLNQEVALSMHKVLVHRLDQETGRISTGTLSYPRNVIGWQY
ncbi:hypothetical protein PoB_001257600 [Plakobranchus ocellatus]|uniref:Uncharacterized protein n=1 Tax=Plakobranchus ocellatus TaxID=259542 RepID=A0AAV3YRX1_9GAST|nr:hypothetical protein PoB_001257600 [Plakobranchus ocellatus]